MRMYMTLTMDRPIIKNEHYLSPGGYEMQFGDRKVEFDFHESCGSINEQNPAVIDYTVRDLDTSAFPDSDVLDNINFLRTLTNIIDFYIYTGEDDEPEIHLAQIDAVSFETSDCEQFDIPASILDAYNASLKNS